MDGGRISRDMAIETYKTGYQWEKLLKQQNKIYKNCRTTIKCVTYLYWEYKENQENQEM